VQIMSAGTGIRHSEFNPSPDQPVHFLQIWVISDRDGITPRYASPERLEIIYTAPTGLSGSGTMATASLSSFKSQWIEAFEQVLYTTNGVYQLTLRRVSDGVVLLAYTNNNLNLWRGDATFNRPKWGIYRSLNSTNYLRDEQVRFADFCLAKGGDICPSDVALKPPKISALKLAGGNFVFTATNGEPGQTCRVLTTTNLLLPTTNWTRAATNRFNAAGVIVFTNKFNSTGLQTFYRLQMP